MEERLRTRYPDLQCPAVSTVHAVLDRHDLRVAELRLLHGLPPDSIQPKFSTYEWST